MNNSRANFILGVLVMVFMSQPDGRERSNELAKVQAYQDLSLNKRMRLFHLQLKKALNNPLKISELGLSYTNGLMQHIAYSENGPSFVTFSELHEAFHRELLEKRSEDLSLVLNQYQKKFKDFKERISKIDIKSYAENYLDYEKDLDRLYAMFLISLIQENYTAFERRFIQHITNDNQLDIIDRAFFALQPNWPSYEKFSVEHENSKHQFESLYVYKASNGKIFIVSYNNRALTCDSYVRLFKVNIASSPLNIVYLPVRSAFNEGADISPQSRAGGCGYKAEILKAVQFDGRCLKIHGYDYQVYREYVFDTETENWKVTPEISN